VPDYCGRAYLSANKKETKIEITIKKGDGFPSPLQLGDRRKTVQMLNLKTNIKEMDELTLGAYCNLSRAGITTLAQILATTDFELLSIKGIGHWALSCIRRAAKMCEFRAGLIAEKLEAAGYATDEAIMTISVENILAIESLRMDEIGYILLYQRDMGGKYNG
jgi:hypothetical protein